METIPAETEEALRKPRIKPEREVTPYEMERINWYINNSVPEKHKLATRRALLGQVSRSVAIRINCLQCCNYERKAVKLCEVVTCAIYPLRPYKDKDGQIDTDSEDLDIDQDTDLDGDEDDE